MSTIGIFFSYVAFIIFFEWIIKYFPIKRKKAKHLHKVKVKHLLKKNIQCILEYVFHFGLERLLHLSQMFCNFNT